MCWWNWQSMWAQPLSKRALNFRKSSSSYLGNPSKCQRPWWCTRLTHSKESCCQTLCTLPSPLSVSYQSQGAGPWCLRWHPRRRSTLQTTYPSRWSLESCSPSRLWVSPRQSPRTLISTRVDSPIQHTSFPGWFALSSKYFPKKPSSQGDYYKHGPRKKGISQS